MGGFSALVGFLRILLQQLKMPLQLPYYGSLVVLLVTTRERSR
jgi:hypothetical protein